jgi:hypothetical protein
MIPGRVNRLVVEPTRTGSFRGVCAKFCGESHALMAFSVEVMEPAAFEQWLAQAGRRRRRTRDASGGARPAGVARSAVSAPFRLRLLVLPDRRRGSLLSAGRRAGRARDAGPHGSPASEGLNFIAPRRFGGVLPPVFFRERPFFVVGRVRDGKVYETDPGPRASSDILVFRWTAVDEPVVTPV